MNTVTTQGHLTQLEETRAPACLCTLSSTTPQAPPSLNIPFLNSSVHLPHHGNSRQDKTQPSQDDGGEFASCQTTFILYFASNCHCPVTLETRGLRVSWFVNFCCHSSKGNGQASPPHAAFFHPETLAFSSFLPPTRMPSTLKSCCSSSPSFIVYLLLLSSPSFTHLNHHTLLSSLS